MMTVQTELDPMPMTRFWVIFSGQGFSLLGTRLVQFALVWWLTNQSNSATVLATAALIALLPQIIVGPFAGVIVDRLDRRKIMIAADSMIALVIIGLAALFATGRVQVWHIYLAMFTRSLGSSFHWPAFQASTSLMVKKEDLGRVGGMNQALRGFVTIAVPPLAAVLLEFMPIQSILIIDVATAVIAVLPLFVYSIPKQDMMKDVMTLSSIYSDFREGLSFIWRWTGMMYIWSLALLLKILLIPAFTLLPLYIKDYFGGGAIEYAWIQSANGIGLIVGGLFLGVWGGFEKKILTAMGAYTLAGTGLVAFGLVPSGLFSIGVATVFLFSTVISIGDASFFAMLQASVPPEMQGRVLMISMSLGAATGPIGLVLAGPLSDLYGIKVWFVGAGLVLGLISFTALFVPAILRIEEGSTIS
jgi:DHA3 family macrolide efflux protein-like MFS transporter